MSLINTKSSRGQSSQNRAEAARHSCESARKFEKAGEYEAARQALEEFWPTGGQVPGLDGLDDLTKAEVLLRIGNVLGSLGSARSSPGSQETAKNLLTRSLDIFQAQNEMNRAAEARSDLALSYWREGAFDEARVLLRQALDEAGEDQKEIRATALIRSAIVEKGAARYTEALNIFGKTAPLVEGIDNHALKGCFHNTHASLLNLVGLTEKENRYIDQALIEFAAASYHFEQAGNKRDRAKVENNLGYLFSTIRKFDQAYLHLDRARKLFRELEDFGTIAQIDDTRARTLLAEGRLKEAERVARASLQALDKGDAQALLAEALTTHGVVLARMGKHVRAREALDRAAEVAELAGDPEAAGRARLSILEELSKQIPISGLGAIYQSAAELLQRSQDQSSRDRLIACARQVIDAVSKPEEPRREMGEDVIWEGFSFKEEMVKSEKVVIERALRAAGGSVTRAAHLLGFRHHQSLISLINNRHKDLLKTRSAVRQRRRHLFSPPTKIKRKVVRSGPEHAKLGISILHVSNESDSAELIDKMIVGEDWLVQPCADGDVALTRLTGDERYDLLLVDNDLTGLGGLGGIELTRRVRRMTHRRRIPIVMLSDGAAEAEAWRAGVDAFLKKPEQDDQALPTMARLLRVDLKKPS
jgi:CheY-like chemotaxis protein